MIYYVCGNCSSIVILELRSVYCLNSLCVCQVLVEYVDYGNEEEVEKSDLRPKLDTPLFSLPSQVWEMRA